MIKLAFIGTHGVGKTTLCYDLGAVLKKRGLHVDLVKEVARLSPLPINRKTSLEAQMWILTTQIAEEIRSAAHHEVVVCDRSVLDNYAYLVFAAGRQQWLEPLVNRWMKSYDLLFKVPDLGRAPRPTAIRDTDEFFMRQIDRLVDELVEERKLPCTRLPEGRRSEWAQMAADEVLRLPALAERLSGARRAGQPGCGVESALRRQPGDANGRRHETVRPARGEPRRADASRPSCSASWSRRCSAPPTPTWASRPARPSRPPSRRRCWRSPPSACRSSAARCSSRTPCAPRPRWGRRSSAGAIFTIPAFVMVNVGGQRLWTSFNYWETSFILLVGGLLGILFIILLRRTLTVDAGLPFPESRACAELVMASQRGDTGARYVFGAMGLGMLIQVFKDAVRDPAVPRDRRGGEGVPGLGDPPLRLEPRGARRRHAPRGARRGRRPRSRPRSSASATSSASSSPPSTSRAASSPGSCSCRSRSS